MNSSIVPRFFNAIAIMAKQGIYHIYPACFNMVSPRQRNNQRKKLLPLERRDASRRFSGCVRKTLNNGWKDCGISFLLISFCGPSALAAGQWQLFSKQSGVLIENNYQCEHRARNLTVSCNKVRRFDPRVRSRN